MTGTSHTSWSGLVYGCLQGVLFSILLLVDRPGVWAFYWFANGLLLTGQTVTMRRRGAPVLWLAFGVMLTVQSLAWWRYRDLYRRWRELVEREKLSILDILTMRRFPDLRDRESLG